MASPSGPQDALHPQLLAQAPELAALALLDVALAVSVRALLAEHPTLELDEHGPEPLSLRRLQRRAREAGILVHLRPSDRLPGGAELSIARGHAHR